jgi:hypothetical protein
MRRATVIAVMAATIISVLARSATAQTTPCTASGSPSTCNRTGSVTMTAGRVVYLQMSAGSTALTAPTPTDFDAGFNATTGPTLTVSANAAWHLYLRSAATYWTATNTSPGAPARTTKPAGDLKWSTAAAGTFNPLTTSDVTLVTGNATASSVTTLYFQTLYAWTLDTPGNYSLAVVLTMTSP